MSKKSPGIITVYIHSKDSGNILYAEHRANDSFPGRGFHHGVSNVLHFLFAPALFTGIYDDVRLNQDLVIQTVNRIERMMMPDKIVSLLT